MKDKQKEALRFVAIAVLGAAVGTGVGMVLGGAGVTFEEPMWGSIIGLVGMVLQRWLEGRSNADSHRRHMALERLDIKRRELDIKYMDKESSAAARFAKSPGAAGDSQVTISRTQGAFIGDKVPQWVTIIRALMRPALTAAGAAALAWLLMDFTKDVIDTVTHLATMMITWWFAGRVLPRR